MSAHPSSDLHQQQQQQHHSSQKTPRILACVLCQNRKIKCDRNSPCSNCLKANVPCTPSTPAPVRKRRRPNQDLQERLARCEALLKQYASTSGPLPPGAAANIANATSGKRSASATIPASTKANSVAPSVASESSTLGASTPISASPASNFNTMLPPGSAGPTSGCAGDEGSKDFKPQGKLVVEDGSVNFMDSYVWGIISENLQAMREIVDAEASEEASPYPSEITTPDDNVDLLLSDFSALELEDVAPSPVQIFRLWQVFLERVNPLTKLVHVPTLQPTVIEAAANHRNVPHNTQALLFAIYLVSVVTLSSQETRQMLDMSKDDAIKKFTAGVKAALIKVNFLKHYDMVTLQALVLYLISLQGRYNRHAAWVLSGLVIRIAQKMGIHRDGETLNLPPFETEMRRRVWWQISMLDTKYAMTAGFNDTLHPHGWDAKIPQNVNDTNIFPGSTELQPREGPTEMVFCIILYHVGDYLRQHRLPGFEEAIIGGQAAEPGSPSHATAMALLDRFSSICDELGRRLEDLEKRFCDVSQGPVHVLATGIRVMLTDKMRTILKPMRETPEWGKEVNNVSDNLFRISVLHQEAQLERYDLPETRCFLWFFKSHFQVDHFFFLVGQLYARQHTGSLADRAWNVVEKIYEYHEEVWDMTQKQNCRVASFVLKAWRRREKALQDMGVSYDVPTCVPRLQDALPQSGSEASSTGPSPAQNHKLMDLGISEGPLQQQQHQQTQQGQAQGQAGQQQRQQQDTGVAGSNGPFPFPSGGFGPGIGGSDADVGDLSLDFMNGLVDTGSLDWDMWTDLGPSTTGGMTGSSAMGAFGPFDNFGAPPPGAGW